MGRFGERRVSGASPRSLTSSPGSSRGRQGEVLGSAEPEAVRLGLRGLRQRVAHEVLPAFGQDRATAMISALQQLVDCFDAS